MLLYDHECDYLGADVGMRNYLPFLLILRAAFVFYVNSVLCCLVGIFYIIRVRPNKDELPIFSITAAVFGAYFSCTGIYF